MKFRWSLFTVVFFYLAQHNLWAQEHEVALGTNPLLHQYKRQVINGERARTEITLPFFEDFNQTDFYPQSQYWQDSSVFVNNTLGKRVKSIGVATFDAFDFQGFPYNLNNPFLSGYSDSLTSQFIDLSSYEASDSLYLSFLYQGKGNGYAPQAGDSLILFFQRRNGSWARVWEQKGQAMELFSTAMIALTDTSFFHPDFRIRWVNKATYNVGNAQWHLDYIKLDQNRDWTDTLTNDLAFSYWGNDDFNRSILNEYQSMPYNHFMANQSAHLSAHLGVNIWNNWSSTQSTGLNLKLINLQSGQTNTIAGDLIYISYNDGQTYVFNLPNNLNSLNMAGPGVIDVSCYFSAPIAGDFSQENDTVRHRQVFDNYFAYDDGSAESAFFLTSYSGAPSYVAQEFAFEVQDTLRGIQLHLPRQVPDASHKSFTIQVYKKIDAVGGQDELIYEEYEHSPQYSFNSNGFSNYVFNQAQVLGPGSFFIALKFPAGGVNDSLYIGLDKNKNGANFRYYKVESHWQPSLLEGALMMRPLVGGPVPVSVPELENNLSNHNLQIYPNPSRQYLNVIHGQTEPLVYQIFDITGTLRIKGKVADAGRISMGELIPGNYVMVLMDSSGAKASKQIVIK